MLRPKQVITYESLSLILVRLRESCNLLTYLMLQLPKVTALKCYLLTPITLPFIPMVQAIAVHRSVMINGGKEESPPPSEM